MNIVLYCDDSGNGGTAVNAALLAEGFTQAGHQTLLVCGDQDNPFAPPGLRCEQLGYSPMFFRAKARLSRNEPEHLFLRERPSLVFFCDASPESSLAAKRVCRDWGIPYVVLVNYVAPVLPADFAGHLDAIARAYHGALAVVAVSSQNLKLLHTVYGVPAQRSAVVYNGRPRLYFEAVAADRRAAIRRAAGLAPEDVLCLTIARYEARKGYRHLLEAAARLAASPAGQRLRYVWIGHDSVGEREPLAREVAARGLASRIAVMGPRDDVRDWLGAADVFVLPSESEGMPLCVIEAMGQALPVVATAVSGIPEQLGDTGLLLPDPGHNRWGMVAALSSALAGLAAHPAERRRLGEAGRQRALALFSAETMLSGYLAVLARLEPSIGAANPRYPDAAAYRSPAGIRPGLDILFGQDAATVEFLKTGWSHGEGEGRWTDGARAVLTLRLPAGECQGYGIQFEAKPFHRADGIPVSVRIVFCNREIGRICWPPASEALCYYDFAFFPTAPLPAVGDLVFEISGASSPFDNGISNDTRLLGLWFTRLRVEVLLTSKRGKLA